MLKVDLKPKSFFTFSKDEAKKLNKVYVAGYPLGKGLSNDLKISSGIVSSLKGFEDNSNEIQIDAPINPGNSGGPIINENGDMQDVRYRVPNINQCKECHQSGKSIQPIGPKARNLNSSIDYNDGSMMAILEEGTVYTYCN